MHVVQLALDLEREVCTEDSEWGVFIYETAVSVWFGKKKEGRKEDEKTQTQKGGSRRRRLGD